LYSSRRYALMYIKGIVLERTKIIVETRGKTP
jgi:hypothetical protein